MSLVKSSLYSSELFQSIFAEVFPLLKIISIRICRIISDDLNKVVRVLRIISISICRSLPLFQSIFAELLSQMCLVKSLPCTQNYFNQYLQKSSPYSEFFQSIFAELLSQMSLVKRLPLTQNYFNPYLQNNYLKCQYIQTWLFV